MIPKPLSSKSFFRDRLVRFFLSLIVANIFNITTQRVPQACVPLAWNVLRPVFVLYLDKLRKLLCYIYECGKQTTIL